LKIMFVKWLRAGVLKPRVDHRGVERYVIFDLDDTLVHSDAVREAFAMAARECDVDIALLTRTLDALPGRPAHEIFETLGVEDADAATGRFLECLDELNGALPTVAYADADTTLRELAARGSTLMLSTGSSPERAQKVLDQEGWDSFKVVLGSDESCRKGTAHYEQFAAQAPNPTWTTHAITIGDSPADMRLGAQHGVPIRIGVDRDGDPRPLLAAGATHVVTALADVLAIIPAA
jgi:phosphoglycolate phosphatase-like HAD superfamily hydrolase